MCCYHQGLLNFDFDDSAAIDLAEVVAAQNKVVQQIGEIAALDKRKTFAKSTDGLGIVDQAVRASVMKSVFLAEVLHIESIEIARVANENTFLDAQQPRYASLPAPASSDLVTYI